MPTLRRRVAAIARACGVAGHPLDTKLPAIRATLRGIGRKHGSPARRAAALTIAEVRERCRACGAGIAGALDRALFLLGFAGALCSSELEIAIADREQVDRPQDHLGGELAAFQSLVLPDSCSSSLSAHVTASTRADRRHNDATEPAVRR